MLTGLLASARELRNPLTVGYSVLFTVWLLWGEEWQESAQDDALGRRLLDALGATGGASELALVTFVAAIVGSILWYGVIARLTRAVSVLFRHPDWPALIEQAREEVRRYEEYEVTTYKGTTFDKPSSSDARHRVPSPHRATYLQERVEERERKAGEMSFRVTLALALIPVAWALGVEGGGRWWLAWLAVPVVWVDVSLMKYTTWRSVRRYQSEDLQEQLERWESRLEGLKGRDYSSQPNQEVRDQMEGQRRQDIEELESQIRAIEEQLAELQAADRAPLARVFAWVEGDSTG